MRFHFLLFLSILFINCAETQYPDTESLVDEFYTVYGDRNDFDRFLEFYDESIILEDIISGERIEGKENLRIFFDWNNPSFELLEGKSLTITEKIVNKEKAVVKGYFTQFSWGGTEFNSMHFTTLLTFNKSGKIVRQVDWINYPASLIDYSKRKNSNDWID